VNLLKLAQVMAKTARSRAAIYAAVKAGTFPKPVPIGIRAVAWVEAEIDEFIRGQIAARDEKHAQRTDQRAA
jgi:prophage regulatory protein